MLNGAGVFTVHENPPENPSVARLFNSKLPKFRVAKGKDVMF